MVKFKLDEEVILILKTAAQKGQLLIGWSNVSKTPMIRKIAKKLGIPVRTIKV